MGFLVEEVEEKTVLGLILSHPSTAQVPLGTGWMGGGGREGETDRQTDRQTETEHRERETDRQTDRQTEQRERENE